MNISVSIKFKYGRHVIVLQNKKFLVYLYRQLQVPHYLRVGAHPSCYRPCAPTNWSTRPRINVHRCLLYTGIVIYVYGCATYVVCKYSIETEGGYKKSRCS